jgi:uncharacterized protein YgiM (DUF1202 family)
MGSQGKFKYGLLAIMVLILAGACEQARYYPPPVYYYVSPISTYLRDCPGYECAVVVDVYSGDQVELLDRTDYGWSRVRLTRNGIIGWLPADLLSSAPLPPTYYVALSNVYLRECADYNCRALELMYRGDRVEKLDQNYLGWWRVRSTKTGITGWMTVSALSPRPGPPFYYVNVSSLALRSGPSTSHRLLTTLSFNQQVEMLGMSPAGWAQVRDTRNGMIGWVAARYIEPYPLSYPRPVPKKAKALGKKAAPEEEAPKTPPPKAM